jgi:hypothetical protein
MDENVVRSQQQNPPNLVVQEEVQSESLDTNPILDMVDLEKKEKKSADKIKVFYVAALAVVLITATVVAIYFASKNFENAENPEEERPQGLSANPVINQTVQEMRVRVGSIEGDAFKISDGRKVQILRNDYLKSGDVVSVSADSEVALLLPDGSEIDIVGESRTTLTKFEESEYLISNDGGNMFFVVKNNPDRQFKVITEGVEITSVSTLFTVENEEDVYVSVFQGRVEVSSMGDQYKVEENYRWNKQRTESELISATVLRNNSFLSRFYEKAESLKLEGVGEVLSSEDVEILKQEFLKTAEGQLISINLESQLNENDTVTLSWVVDGLSINGFRIVWSLARGPEFPKRNDNDKATASDIFGYEKTLGPFKPGQKLYFKVCESLGNRCGIYSNEELVVF